MRLLAVLAALAVPASAWASPASIGSRDVPLRGERELSGSVPPFDLVGLHWQGPGSVSFRTRSVSGRWSVWRAAAPEDEDGPDLSGSEHGRPGWRVGNPYWTGSSDRIEYRLRGAVRRLRAYFVRSPVDRTPARTLSIAGSPPIVPRLFWGANELIKRAAPSYATSLRFAIVHHTAGANAYTREQSAAIVRAIQLYHVRGNGWNDVGYNFLVDKFGQVFEGRFGGAERNVVGAHAQGFNTGSVGVAVLGSYGSTGISAAARSALVELLSWRLDIAHADPLSTFSWPSGGNARFPAGVPVFLRAISGHRDTGFTACPGNVLYGTLDSLAGAVSLAGLPKLYTPAVQGRVGGPIRFTARLSAALPWTVAITDGLGQQVGSGSGTGGSVDWTWDSAAAPGGTYAYAISAGSEVRPAAGSLGTRAAALTLTQLRADPAAVTPNGDGRDETTTISYTLSLPATVTATLLEPSGRVVATLFSGPRTAGEQRFVLGAESVPDGTYRVVLTAVNQAGEQVTSEVAVLVNRTLSAFAAERSLFSPNRDGRGDVIRFRFTLAVPADVSLRVLKAGRWVATPFAGPLDAGPQAISWNGSKRLGRLPDGSYEAELSATDAIGTVSQRVQFAADTRRPVLRLLSARRLRFWLSEPAELTAVVNGRRLVVERRVAGAFTVPWRGSPRRIRALARDGAANVSRPVRFP